MPKLIKAPMDIPDNDLMELGVFLSKEDCKLLCAELSHYGCFNQDRKKPYDEIMDLVTEVANG